MAKKDPKVSKIMLWPSRKINLGNYNSAELNAGVEIVFDEAVDIKSPLVQQAFEDARKVIHDEFLKQYEPYKAKLDKKD